MGGGRYSLVNELAEFALDGELVAFGAGLDMANDLSIDAEALGDLYNLLRIGSVEVDLKTVAHIEDLVHLLPVCTALLLDGAEEGRHREKIVLDDVDVLDEVHDLGLRTARAVNHTVDLRTELVEEFLDHGSVCARRAEYEFASVDGAALNGVGEFEATGVDEVVGNGGIVCLRVFLSEIFGEDIMTGGGETIAAHAAIVLLLVGCLTVGRKANDNVASLDIGVVYHILATHTASDGRIDNDGAHEVADIGSLAARGVNSDTHLAKFGEEFVGAIDDGRDDLTWHEHLVSADGAGDEDIVNGAHAEEVVDVHNERILRDAFPDGEVAGLLPIGVGEAALGAGAVGVHDVAPFGVASEDVGDNLAEGSRVETLIDVLDGVVDVLLGGTNAAQGIPLV